MEATGIAHAEPLDPTQRADAAHEDAAEEAATRAREDPAAFAQVYVRHREEVYRYLRARSSSDDDALELTAVTFERALRAIHGYRRRGGGVRAWLLRIARNAVIDDERRRSRLESADDLATRPSTDASPEDRALASDERARLRRHLAALPDVHRDALALRYGAGLSANEIGLVVGKSEAATQKLISRALARLREVIDER